MDSGPLFPDRWDVLLSAIAKSRIREFLIYVFATLLIFSMRIGSKIVKNAALLPKLWFSTKIEFDIYIYIYYSFISKMIIWNHDVSVIRTYKAGIQRIDTF